jgi:hypothetical protein
LKYLKTIEVKEVKIMRYFSHPVLNILSEFFVYPFLDKVTFFLFSLSVMRAIISNFYTNTSIVFVSFMFQK